MSDSEKAVLPEPLSLREIEILRLISEGLTNREIAQRLVLSVDTIKWYNKQIFSKLGVSSRTQAASFLRRNHSLVSSPGSTGKSEIGLGYNLPEHNLPLPLNSFLGREEEIAQITSSLRGSSEVEANSGEKARLVTLTGPGGVGKTRLAVQTAFDLVKKYPHGVWLVDFAPLSNPLFVPQTVVATLGVREDGSMPMITNLIAYLREKSILLVFDNCEHLIDSCAQLTAAILSACPGVSVLATSREPFGIAGENVLTVPPFTIPDAVDALPLEIQSTNEAVRLFIDRAKANLADFTLSSANAMSVLEVCRRLDGLPLAIELAAARVNVLAVSEIAARLENSFQLLGHGDRTVLPRAQTLQACMDWSYTLLSYEERLLLNRLSIFVGGWTLDAAEKVCAGGQINPLDVFHLLAQLIEKSLIVVDRRQSTGIRYRFLETIYRYAHEKLIASGESTTLKGRHLVYFLNIAENRDVFIPDRELIEWLNWMDSEHDNLRAALDWSLNEQVDPVLCYRLAKQLGDFWEHHGFLDEGRARFAKILARPGTTESSPEIADLLFQYAWLAVYQSDHQAGRRLLEQSRVMFEKLHPQEVSGEVNVLNSLAAIEIDSGDASIARDYAQKALEIADGNDYPYGASFAHHLLGVALGHLGEYGPAWDHMHASLAINSKIDRGSMSLIHNMGELAVRQGDYEKGKLYLQRGIKLVEEAGDKWNLAAALGTLGWAELIQEEYHPATRHLRESIMIRQTIGDKGGIAWCLEKLAALALRQGSPDKATTILGAAAALRSEANSIINSADKPLYDALLVSLREQIEPHIFQTAWDTGSMLALEEVIQLALLVDQVSEKSGAI